MPINIRIQQTKMQELTEITNATDSYASTISRGTKRERTPKNGQGKKRLVQKSNEASLNNSDKNMSPMAIFKSMRDG